MQKLTSEYNILSGHATDLLAQLRKISEKSKDFIKLTGPAGSILAAFMETVFPAFLSLAFFPCSNFPSLAFTLGIFSLSADLKDFGWRISIGSIIKLQDFFTKVSHDSAIQLSDLNAQLRTLLNNYLPVERCLLQSSAIIKTIHDNDKISDFGSFIRKIEDEDPQI
uniref:Uncharacterized protein n=1 Tax=Globodera pallida TaxID=36090 RepID=A0A183CCZ5_GLOPA